MSRGGRFGAAARGGLKGATWEYDATLALDSKPTELFPEYNVPFPTPLTASEKVTVDYYKSLQTDIHNGPLYTKAPPRDPANLPKVFGEKQANDIFSSRNQSDFDPFTGVPTYEMKYEKKTRAIPLLSGRPFIKDFFPAELHSTLDGTDGFGGAVKGATRKRLILASSMTQEEKDRRIRERLDDVVGDEVEGENEEEEQEEEPEDYDFEDDEEENAGDYDAEQYFDDGDDMGDEDEGGGGGDDY